MFFGKVIAVYVQQLLQPEPVGTEASCLLEYHLRYVTRTNFTTKSCFSARAFALVVERLRFSSLIRRILLRIYACPKPIVSQVSVLVVTLVCFSVEQVALFTFQVGTFLQVKIAEFCATQTNFHGN